MNENGQHIKLIQVKDNNNNNKKKEVRNQLVIFFFLCVCQFCKMR